MKICAVICELNPVHNGHKYIFDKAKEITGADYLIALMSGSYVQRGEPALFDKHTRTRMALNIGADAVLELPGIFATGSAQYFARGAVALLTQLGNIDYLCFGSESGSISHIMEEDIHESNDILAKEYLNALLYFDSSITPVAIKRIGTDYNNKDSIIDGICSATYIRNSIVNGKNDFYDAIPKACQNDFTNTPVYYDDYSDVIYTSIVNLCISSLSQNSTDLSLFFDVYGDLSDKITKNIYSYESAESFCHLLKSKDIAFSHIKRALLHIALGYTKSDMDLIMSHSYFAYLRLLGFKKASLPLLSSIKESSDNPLISKLSDYESILKPYQRDILKKDINASMIYEYIRHRKDNMPVINEYRKNIVIM